MRQAIAARATSGPPRMTRPLPVARSGLVAYRPLSWPGTLFEFAELSCRGGGSPVAAWNYPSASSASSISRGVSAGGKLDFVARISARRRLSPVTKCVAAAATAAATMAVSLALMPATVLLGQGTMRIPLAAKNWCHGGCACGSLRTRVFSTSRTQQRPVISVAAELPASQSTSTTGAELAEPIRAEKRTLLSRNTITSRAAALRRLHRAVSSTCAFACAARRGPCAGE